MCLFVQWQISVCAVGILHEADLEALGIKAYVVGVFVTQGAARIVFFLLEHVQVDILNTQILFWLFSVTGLLCVFSIFIGV